MNELINCFNTIKTDVPSQPSEQLYLRRWQAFLLLFVRVFMDSKKRAGESVQSNLIKKIGQRRGFKRYSLSRSAVGVEIMSDTTGKSREFLAKRGTF